MEPLTVEALRGLAHAQGLDLDEDELRRLLPLVQANRRLLESLAGVPLDVEPSSHFRIL